MTFQDQVEAIAGKKRREQKAHTNPIFQTEFKGVKVGKEICDCNIFEIFVAKFLQPVGITSPKQGMQDDTSTFVC